MEWLYFYKWSNYGILNFASDFALFAYSETFQHMFPISQEVKVDSWINLV
jgi:hypothetical protein